METDDESETSVVHVEDVTEHLLEAAQSLSTSAVLSHCKKKILLPYQRVLSVMGLREISHPVFSFLSLTVVFSILLSGYFLQYMTCFRRDIGYNSVENCGSSIVYSHIIPSLLHLAGYLQALFTMRVRETERLETLMERTFLLAAHRSAGITSTQGIVRNLWVCIACSVLWIVISVIVVLIMVCSYHITILWVSSEASTMTVNILLVVTTLWHDMVQATVVTSYCLQILLLSNSLALLRSKLLQHSFHPLEWLREVSECQQSIRYLNEALAPAVSILCLLDIAWAGAGVATLIQQGSKVNVMTCIMVLVWSTIAIIPILAAAHLTSSCKILRGLGHEIRARPFVYQSTPASDLDTILLFTSSLRMRAKLCGLPILSHYIYIILIVIFLGFLILGQCHIV